MHIDVSGTLQRVKLVLGSIIAAICAICLCWYFFNVQSQLPNPPPGTRHPPCLATLPVVGSLTFLESEMHKLAQQFMDKSKSLGAVFALYFGSK